MSFGARAVRGASTTEDQLCAAVHTENALEPAGGSVLAVAARLRTDIAVHHAPTLRAVTHRRVRPSMIQIFASANHFMWTHALHAFLVELVP